MRQARSTLHCTTQPPTLHFARHHPHTRAAAELHGLDVASLVVLCGQGKQRWLNMACVAAWLSKAVAAGANLDCSALTTEARVIARADA